MKIVCFVMISGVLLTFSHLALSIEVAHLLNPHSGEQVVYILHINMRWEYTTSIHVSILLLMASALHRRAPVSCRRSPLGPVSSFFHSFCVRFDLLNAELLTFLF